MIIGQVLTESNQPGFANGLGSLLTGISEVLLALGAGIGFIIRYRQNARNAIKNRGAIAELENQYEERITQLEETIERQQHVYDHQQRMYEEKLKNLQTLNTRLVNQVLKLHRP